jgi:hypothetical protein
MSRLARAIEILEAINEHFQEAPGQGVLYSDAQILEGDVSIEDAVADCLGTKEEAVAYIPHSRRRRFGKNWYGNWVGFIGDHKVIEFPDEEAAVRWVSEQ